MITDDDDDEVPSWCPTAGLENINKQPASGSGCETYQSDEIKLGFLETAIILVYISILNKPCPNYEEKYN